MANRKQKILLIGWDAAEWKVIDPLISEGKMPNLQNLMGRGSFGRLQTLDPPLSPMLWTSIATGVRPDKHGIIGFVEPNSNGDGLRPVTSTSRKVKAIWNILNQNDYKSNVIAWWPSNPVEPINGVMVSNLFQLANSKGNEPWISPPESVHPEKLTHILEEFRVHPHELTPSIVAPFIPNLIQDLDLRKDKRTQGVLKTIANAATVHSVSTYLQEETEWDFMAVYHDAIDHFCHLSMKYHPPKQLGIKDKDYDDFKNVVEAGYRFHDLMLGRSLELVDDETTIVLISDHGFHSDHLRPQSIPHEPSGPAIEHSPFGIFVIAGPGIQKGGNTISGASILDITPTLLHYLSLPVGKDMDGKILHGIFENPSQPTYVNSWEEIEGNHGMHPVNKKEDTWLNLEAIQQLVDLGYIDAPDDDKLKDVEKCKDENQYYLARTFLQAGKPLNAIEILKSIYHKTGILRYGQRLAYAFMGQKQYQETFELLEDLKIQHQKTASNFEKNNKDPFLNMELEDPLYLKILEGLLWLAVNRPRKAYPILTEIQNKSPLNLQVCLQLGFIHLQRKQYAQAQNQFTKALALDPQNAKAHHGLGIAFLRDQEFTQATEEFLLAIQNDFYFPNAHYHLGETLAKQKLWEDAIIAFEASIRLAPGMIKAHRWLLHIYKEEMSEDLLSQKHSKFLKENIRKKLIVITSVDGVSYQEFLLANPQLIKILSPRKFDLKALKSLQNSTSWLYDMQEPSVFIPCHLLSFLPQNIQYKLLIIESPESTLIENLHSEYKNKVSNNEIWIGAIEKIKSDKRKIETWMNASPKLDHYYFYTHEGSNDSELEFLNNWINQDIIL